MKGIVLIFVATASFLANPSVEIVWHPVEQLTSSVEHVQLLLKMNQQKAATVVVVTGLIPVVRQGATIKESVPDLPDKRLSLVEIIDFTVERQELDASAKPSLETPTWKTLSLDDADSVLQMAASQQAEVVSPLQSTPVCTMPLPSIIGTWPKSVAHPKLTADHVLFRFMDFAVKPGYHYRYRVRLEYANPNYQNSPDPFIAAGETRMTPWSQPSPTVLLAR